MYTSTDICTLVVMNTCTLLQTSVHCYRHLFIIMHMNTLVICTLLHVHKFVRIIKILIFQHDNLCYYRASEAWRSISSWQGVHCLIVTIIGQEIRFQMDTAIYPSSSHAYAEAILPTTYTLLRRFHALQTGDILWIFIAVWNAFH